MTKVSRYKSTPKWTIAPSVSHTSGKQCAQESRGPAAYNPSGCLERTSKFKRIGSACSFGSSRRFTMNARNGRQTVPGPGQYSPPSDYSYAPYRSGGNIIFGIGRCDLTSGNRSKNIFCPGPGEYDIRGKHRAIGATMDCRGVHVNHRHGWYYDPEIKSSKGVPSPGTYNPHFPHEKSDRKVSFGSGDRPPVHRTAAVGLPSPGRYDIPSSLGGSSFSFTHGVSKASVPVEMTVGPLCGQPTQFG